MKSQGNAGFVAITGIIIAFTRLVLGNINSISDDVILIIMALVNYVAFGFVLLFLHNDINNICLNNINNSGISTEEKTKAKSLIKIFSGIFLIAYFIIGILYTAFFKSNNWNDAISIVALAFSIASSGLANTYSSWYYNFLVKKR